MQYNIIRFTYVILLVLIFGSCNDNSDSTGDIRSIQIDPEQRSEYTFNDFFELDHYITLESTEESMINSVRKITISRNYIYILTWGESRVMIFNHDGEFLSKIDKNGSGPGEYNYVVDMQIDQVNEYVWLYDKNLKKLFCYDHHEALIKDIDLSVDLESFMFLENGNIIGYSFLNRNLPYNEKDYMLWFFDKSGNIITGSMEVDKDYLGNSIGLSSTLSTNGEKQYFIPYTENVLYSINPEEKAIKPEIRFDFMERCIPQDLFELERSDFWEPLRNSYMMFGQFVGSKTVVFNIIYSAKAEMLSCITDIEGDRFTLLSAEDVIDAENEVPLHIGNQNHYIEGTKLIAMLEPYKLLDYNFKGDSTLGKQLSTQISESDNPVLLIYKER